MNFEALYQEHADQLLRLLLEGFSYRSKAGAFHHIRVYERSDAEELTQQAFVAFYQQYKKGNFDPCRPVTPYLRRIAINLALKHIGRQTKEPNLPSVDIGTEPFEAQLLQREREALLTEFKRTLAQREREVLEGYYGRRRSQRSLGQSLGLSRDQIYRILRKTEERARAYFAQHGWLEASA